jgi:hypothetical protein
MNGGVLLQLVTAVFLMLSASANLAMTARAIARERKAQALLDSLKVVGKVEAHGDGFNVYIDPQNVPIGQTLYTVRPPQPERTMTL